MMITASITTAAISAPYDDEELSSLFPESDTDTETEGVVGILFAVGIVASEPMSVGQK